MTTARVEVDGKVYRPPRSPEIFREIPDEIEDRCGVSLGKTWTKA